MVSSMTVRPAVYHSAWLRNALLASVALAFMAGAATTGLATPAAAATSKAGVKSKPESKDSAEMPKGPLQIVVSIAHQHVTLYSNGTRVAQTPVSTGMPGKPTPTGVFSIIQKDRYHHSNLYSNAPMPYMERITWSGVALHEGPLPGYAASHGCIRLTHDFALRLWGIAKLGVRVIVARTDVAPVDFAHPLLFVPKAKPEPPVADTNPEKHVQGPVQAPVQIRLAQAMMPATGAVTDAGAASAPPPSSDPLRGAVGAQEADPDTTAATPGTPAGASDTVTPPAVVQATPTQATPTQADPPKPASNVDDPAKATPPKTAPKALGEEQPPKRSGQVAVFISRKEKKLYVRQAFVPLFDMPVEIEHPEQPFGTHVFTAMGFTDDGAGMRWNLMSIPAEAPRALPSPKIGKKREPVAAAETFEPQTAAQVLDRIQIPQEAKDRIGEILTPGSSLVVSDQGLGGETGQGTDFIVLTR
jgi:hypothetical protein